MGLFSKLDAEKIAATAKKSIAYLPPPPKVQKNTQSVVSEINKMAESVKEYFKDSKAILITTKEELHDYVTKAIESGYAGIDTETTGLDRIKDYIVGTSLYFPNGVECYIPTRHMNIYTNEPYPNQLTYSDIQEEYQRMADSDIKLIFANADFDLAMIYKDFHVDFIPNCYYDVIIAWRVLKENERENGLKPLYSKYVLRGHGDPMKFRDFFTPQLFPYCKPEVAKLYAANDAKITYELFQWQLPYVIKSHIKCKKNHLEALADLLWNVEFPMIPICQKMHRNGIYLEASMSNMLRTKYHTMSDEAYAKLAKMVQEVIDDPQCASHVTNNKWEFKSGTEFNPNSVPQVKFLCYTLLQLGDGKDTSTSKELLYTYNSPVINQLLYCRSLTTLIGTFIDKLPDSISSDHRIHCQFKQIGAATGRLSSADPNMQNIPSHHNDIRLMFRATPGYVMLSSDYSQQEPKITAFVSQDPKMIQAFKDGKDIYSIIASLAFNMPYEDCKEFTPTGEFNVEGKKRRTAAKSIVLGITYGRSVATIADQLYSHEDIPDEEKIKKAQHVYDSVLDAFPDLKKLTVNAQACAKKLGYVETILGRRRHIPEMQLPEFEFKAMHGYQNPDIDPLDIDTLDNTNEIPQRIQNSLYKEFKSYKWFGQIARRTKELAEKEHIRVINNTKKITDASRKCVNSIIQGSAADQTKLAMLMIDKDEEWNKLGGRLLVPVHDELIAEVPIENWEAGAKRLGQLMCDAASFLPFASKTDVAISYRWYGLEFPCKYEKPDVLDKNTNTESQIQWIQYHLYECGYELPVFNAPNGDKPEGDAALGVNGVWTTELENRIADFCKLYEITEDKFIEWIYSKVHTGYTPTETHLNL